MFTLFLPSTLPSVAALLYFIAGGGHEQDALLVYNSCTQGSEPCCRPGVTWKRARAAPHHPEQPKSVRVYMGVMQAIHPRESRERNEGSRPRVERKGKKKGRREDETDLRLSSRRALNGSVVGEVWGYGLGGWVNTRRW
jgi:hypothetical protein